MFENTDVDENNLFNTGFINIDDSNNCNLLQQLNEANPFDDFTITNLFDDNIPHETHSVNVMLEIYLHIQQDKNTEEVSLISSCNELVNYAIMHNYHLYISILILYYSSIVTNENEDTVRVVDEMIVVSDKENWCW